MSVEPVSTLNVTVLSVTAVLIPFAAAKARDSPVLNVSEPVSPVIVNDEGAGVSQYETVPFEVRTCPAVPVAPFAVIVVTIAFAVMIRSIHEVPLATRAWLAVSTPGLNLPAMVNDAPFEPMNR